MGYVIDEATRRAILPNHQIRLFGKVFYVRTPTKKELDKCLCTKCKICEYNVCVEKPLCILQRPGMRPIEVIFDYMGEDIRFPALITKPKNQTNDEFGSYQIILSGKINNITTQYKLYFRAKKMPPARHWRDLAITLAKQKGYLKGAFVFKLVSCKKF